MRECYLFMARNAFVDDNFWSYALERVGPPCCLYIIIGIFLEVQMDATTVIGENDQRSNVQAIQVINNDAGKDAMLQAVIAEILNHVVDMACKKCMSFDYFVDRFNIVDSTNYRSNRGLSESAFSVQSDSDTSDEEFERILESTRRHTSLQQEEEDDDTEVAIPVKGNEKFIEHEYDAMPALEELRIHVEEDILLEQFGKIVNIVDRLVVIEADTNTALDFDTVIFDVDRNAVGRVFDIFGPVVKPMYAILFNDIKEANQWKVNSAMYYAPAAAQFTHRIFTEKLRQQMRCREKATDGCWDGEGECPDDMLAFSDDETEQRYKAKHRSIKMYHFTPYLCLGQHACGGPRNKKARYSSKRGRSAYQNNRLYITRQFGNGSEYIQHGDNSAPYLYSAGSSLEQ
uniref:H/ACA ribonucleoprotein complex non-core subunit NAF1 n=1 Tax=Setaria digitata TaxID=48799 RepID=A0A915PYA1_9BILA